MLFGCVNETKNWTALLGISEWECPNEGGCDRFSRLNLLFQTPHGDDKAHVSKELLHWGRDKGRWAQGTERAGCQLGKNKDIEFA